MRPSTDIALACLAVLALSLAAAWLLGRVRRVPARVRLPLRGLLWAAAFGAGAWALLLLGVPLIYDRSPHVHRVAQGVVYRFQHRAHPRPHPVHLLEIALDTPGLRFAFTRPQRSEARPRRSYAAARTSDFLAGQDPACVAAINASFFFPFHSSAPWDYYPHAGDGVDALGRYGAGASVRGKAWRDAPVSFDRGRVQFGVRQLDGDGMLEGRHWLVRDGQPAALPDDRPYSRMALGLRGRTLLAVAVDGKLDRLAEGLTLRELSALMIELGARQAIELDGGGSVTMAARAEGQSPRVLNLVAHTRIPFRERPVATHLGICFDRARASRPPRARPAQRAKVAQSTAGLATAPYR